MTRRISITLGAAAVVAGIAMFAFSFSGGPDSAYGGEATPTVGTTGTAVTTPTGGGTGTAVATGTRTPGPLTPVSTPTTGAATATPSGGGALPQTGMGGGTTDSGDYTWLASLGAALALAGTGAFAFGVRRRG